MKWSGSRPLRNIAGLQVALDCMGVLLLFNVSHRIELEEWVGIISLPLWVILVCQVLVLYVFDLYSFDARSSRLELIMRTAGAVVVAGMIVAGIVYLTDTRESERVFFRGVLSGGFVLFLLWATASRYLATVWLKRFARKMRWLVFCDWEPENPLYRDMSVIRNAGELTVLGPDKEDPGRGAPLLGTEFAGGYEKVEELVANKWSGIVIATQKRLPDKILRRIMEMRLSGIRVYDLTDFYEEMIQKVPVLYIKDNWFALSHGFDLLHHNIQLKIKRLIDVFVAALLLVAASPVMLVIALAIKLDQRESATGPVLYHQVRTGLNGKEFYIHKFRTMINNAEANGPQWATECDDRITCIGRFLRNTRLDELPQLWNVIKGEMSFIGPRPERPDFNKELEKAIPYYDLRHVIKPGITGWAQVKYDYGSSKEEALEKLQYDIFYIKNYSLLLDLFILLKTVRVVLAQKGR